MNTHFQCTGCGQCCHDLRVPLTIAEALAWTRRGHDVCLLTEAMPWLVEPDPGTPEHDKKSRSFPVRCGALSFRVNAILVASFKGPCPNLGADNRCAIYAERPLVCRIYPAEILPYRAFDPARKNCPPEAWATANPLLLQDGACIDADVLTLVQRSRQTTVRETAARARICASLGIGVAALANEGYLSHRPDPARLQDALAATLQDNAAPDSDDAWILLSNRRATVDLLASTGAACRLADAGDGADYLGFFPSDGGL